MELGRPSGFGPAEADASVVGVAVLINGINAIIAYSIVAVIVTVWD